jgi:hypothetical protein
MWSVLQQQHQNLQIIYMELLLQRTAKIYNSSFSSSSTENCRGSLIPNYSLLHFHFCFLRFSKLLSYSFAHFVPNSKFIHRFFLEYFFLLETVEFRNILLVFLLLWLIFPTPVYTFSLRATFPRKEET